MRHSVTSFDSRSYVNDPLFRDVRPYEKTLQSKEWNEYQKMSELNALEVPVYLSKLRKTRLVKLAGVKTGIYNPLLPSIKQMQRDTTLGKLPDEHCRTTSCLSKPEFESRSFYINKPPTKELFSLGGSVDGKQLLKISANDLIAQSKQSKLNETQNKAKLLSQSLDSLTTAKYATRTKTPVVTGGWRYHLNDSKSFDSQGRVPWSNEKINQIRDYRLQYSRYMQPIEARKSFF